MLPIVLMMIVILLVSALVVLYAAFPHRGRDIPRARWFGKTLQKGVDVLPTLKDDASIRH